MMIYQNEPSQKATIIAILVLVSACWFGQALAQQELTRKYSFETLDRCWTEVHATNAELQAHAYLNNVTAEDAEYSIGARTGYYGGGRGGSGGEQAQQFSLFVYPMEPTFEALASSRALSLTFFLNKAQQYQAPPLLSPMPEDPTPAQSQMMKDQQAINDELEKTINFRKYYAQLELFMINLIRYKAANTIVDKCRYVTRTKTLYDLIEKSSFLKQIKQALEDGDELELPYDADERFFEIQLAYIEIANPDSPYPYHLDVTQRKSCVMSPVKSRHETLVAAKGYLEMKIVDFFDDANGEVKTSLSQIGHEVGSFENMKTDVTSISTFTAEVLELERKIENANSNFEMVRDDLLHVGEKLQQVANEVKLENIQDLPAGIDTKTDEDLIEALSPLKAIRENEKDLSVAIGQVHEKLSLLITTPDNPGINDPGVQGACQNLGTADAPNLEGVSICLQKTAEFLQSMKSTSLFEDMVNVFQDYLKALSDEMIYVRRYGA